MVPQVKRWKVTFHYRPGSFYTCVHEYVEAPTRMLALWAARDQRHGCCVRDPDCERETISVVRSKPKLAHMENMLGELLTKK